MHLSQRQFDIEPRQLKSNGMNGMNPNLQSLTELKESRSPLLSRSANFVFNTQTFMIPHPAKVDKGGEDAFFVSSDNKAIGIADGVGGWSLHGIDPAIYAQSMMRDCKLAYEELNLKTPLQMISHAYERARPIHGSSTACVLVLDGSSLLTNNIGDSGFMIIRDEKIFFRFKEQLHSFNYPYQLGTASANVPSDAVNVSFEIKEGDIIVAGSDGLFDNLFDNEILELVLTSEGNIAENIARMAYMKSQSLSIETPFRKTACELGLVESPLGGKLDDITIIVAKASSRGQGEISSIRPM